MANAWNTYAYCPRLNWERETVNEFWAREETGCPRVTIPEAIPLKPETEQVWEET